MAISGSATSTGSFGHLQIQPDTDTGFAKIGRTFIGAPHSDHAGFSHVDQFGANSYALVQSNGGVTALNAASGQSIRLNINNSEIGRVNSSGLQITTGNLSVNQGYNLYLDGGSNTYITSNAGDTIRMVTGGNNRMTIDSGGRVGLSTTTPAEALHIVSSANSATPVILLENNNAGTLAPQINFYNNSSSPADNDYLGQIDFEGKDSAGNRTQYGRIISQIADATANTEDGLLDFNIMYGGTLTNALRIKGSEAGLQISGSLTSTGSFGRIETAGNLEPKVHNTSNLGSESRRWANIYSADLQLSNMDNEEGNEIDGTKGSWTIQEGSDDLYLLNRKNGKKYKFKLEEIT